MKEGKRDWKWRRREEGSGRAGATNSALSRSPSVSLFCHLLSFSLSFFSRVRLPSCLFSDLLCYTIDERNGFES